MITENLSTLKIHKLTQAQYDRELAAGRIDQNALYLTPDEEMDLSQYATKEEVLSTCETKSDASDKLTEAKDYAKEYADAVADGKADAIHNHAISDITSLETSLNAKVPKTRTVNGKALSANITLSADDVEAVPTTRTINGHELTSDITLTAADIGGIGTSSNVQEQLDGKAASSHNHSASNITSGTLSSDRLPTVPIAKGGTGATTAAGALVNLGISATATELNYVDGVTSNIQTQLDAKLNNSDAITNDEIDEICSFAISEYLNTISAEGVSF